MAHGQIAFKEGTVESARRAVVRFQTSLEVYEAIGDVGGIASTKTNIACPKLMNEDDNNSEEMLKANQELYELRIAKLGKESENTIRAGAMYAVKLQDANRGGEAKELLTKLIAISKQVLGPDHNVTKEIKSTLK